MLSIMNWPPVRFCLLGDLWTELQVNLLSTPFSFPADEGSPCWPGQAATDFEYTLVDVYSNVALTLT